MIFQFEFCQFQSVIFYFSRLIVSIFVFILCFMSMLVVTCSIINEILSSVCFLYALVLFDESKRGRKIEIDQIGLLD